MLKKKYRLPSSIRLEKAKTISTKYFVLKTADSNLSFPRFAFVISKKVDRRAVVRNKIKREITSAISQDVDKFTSGRDMIFILKRTATEDITRLGESIKEVFVRQNLLK